MYRSAIKKLKEWKNKEDRKPMILMGARQVGKTWIMKEFGKNEYAKVAYISFYNNERMNDVFDMDFDIDRIIMNLNIESGVSITPNDTLIILDEIQNAPKALESLKYFCEDANEYHVIAAGSLLGVAVHENVSFPVGKVDMLDLYPFSFREFLLAMDEKSLVMALDSKDFSIIDNFSDKFLFWLKNYYYIGGMPAVVDSFRRNKDYVKTRQIQKDILRQYEQDFGKHVDAKNLPRIRMVWQSIPIQLAKENKKFFFGQIKKGARSSDFEIAIQWLMDSGLIYKVNRVNEPHMPLKAYINMSAYKLFILDIGLLGALSDLPAKTILEKDEIFVEFKGAFTEQYVLQQLICDTQYTPYYYGTDKSTFEQDFMIQMEDRIVPIEVKAEGNVYSQSLKAYCEKYHPKKAVRFSTLKYVDQGWMVNIPLYAISTL
ncbi:ATP-binding protein [Holdemanella biformis]|jgi:predicted AAA+ superfamily ATPase|uniref:ATP-binding protein n=2 Tax=Holdemanella biformis TaxID=1735 RepID=A0A413UFM2_9FIRM|nr:ATP-binding protein [Holdemanella biformis]RHB09121.1 ATP-binding protein [Holdemanella biformis]